MSWHDYQVVLAHYALEDPKHELETEIEYQKTRARILRERRARFDN